MQLKDDHIYLPTGDGHFVSEKQRRISEIIKDYNSNLVLQWIPPDSRSEKDLAFRVVDQRPGYPPYVVCFAEQCDERLLATIMRADQRNGNTLDILEAHNRAVELYNLKKRKEKNAAAVEMAYSILHSKKIHYRHNGIDFGARG